MISASDMVIMLQCICLDNPNRTIEPVFSTPLNYVEESTCVSSKISVKVIQIHALVKPELSMTSYPLVWKSGLPENMKRSLSSHCFLCSIYVSSALILNSKRILTWYNKCYKPSSLSGCWIYGVTFS